MRFNCTNGHNFYLTEDQIRRANLVTMQTNFKNARKDLKVYQLSKLKNEKASLPVCSMSYNEDFWCKKCMEYYQ